MGKKKNIYFGWMIACCAALGTGCQQETPIVAQVAEQPTTFCNPLNLNYRFMRIDGGEGIREAADPVVVSYKGRYWLFASKSSGYWYSDDFNEWKYVFIPDSVLPIEDYAPGIFVHDEYMYYVGSTHGEGMLYRSNRPEAGEWEAVKKIWSYWDPAFYLEGDSLYLYYGCSPSTPIYARLLDVQTLEMKSPEVACFNSDMERHGWERPGERNELTRRPYIEGAWMTEHDGKYYLQYAAPGTEWKTYADGTYVGEHPMGPFTYAPNSPVSYKPTGFLGGAGHGCLFQVGDAYWKAVTNSISVRHMFERRVSLYPAGFDADGCLFTDTYLGDYPMYLPKAGEEPARPDWMLLSYRKPVTVSSALGDYPAENLTDEDARTAWVAHSNNAEWVVMDLEQEANICAIQINYDEYGATWKGRVPDLYQSYRLYASHDEKKWYPIVDKSDKRTDTPHDYIEFAAPFKARYIKWENRAYTVSDQVSLREIRVFGTAEGAKPEPVSTFELTANPADACKATITWTPVEGADGYIIRAGIAPNKLYHTYQVTDSTHFELTGLNAGVDYFFAIDAYNGSGVTEGEIQKKLSEK